jgi:hypothetical protein
MTHDNGDALHRFHVDFDNGGEAEYLVIGEDQDCAISRLRTVLVTNDKIHLAYPAPDGSLGNGVFILRDLPPPQWTSRIASGSGFNGSPAGRCRR